MQSVKVIQASENAYTGTKVITFELEYERYIHAEIMTHRMFSRNAQSSRAVPVKKAIEANKEYVKPVVWGANKSGMSSTEELEGLQLEQAKAMWEVAAEHAFVCASRLADIGLHKQFSNRITEPFSHIKVVVTATEWDNFFWLRIDPDAAQPEIVALAQKMKDAYDSANFTLLGHGEWHVPYISRKELSDGSVGYFDSAGDNISIDDALKISASCCAQVSYRNLNDTKEKAIEIYDRLFFGPKPHLSPTEHQCMAFDNDVNVVFDHRGRSLAGITHADLNGEFWSANFKNFIQYRQLIK